MGTSEVGAKISARDYETRLGVSNGEPRVLQGYVDADYAGDLDQQKSTTRYVFTIAECVIVGRQNCKIQLLFQR